MENPYIAPEHQAILDRVASTPGYYVDDCPRCSLPHPSCHCPLAAKDERHRDR
ncbi:MAG: hypothetical protein WD069_15350 [Planctomycetales bacterium]